MVPRPPRIEIRELGAMGRSDPSSGAALPLRQRAFVELGGSPEDEDQWPPTAEESSEMKVSVVVQQKQEAENDQ
jgi:hypothetical protein